MANLIIRDEIFKRLQRLADKQNRPIEDVIESLLQNYPDNELDSYSEDQDLLPGSLARMAQIARHNPIHIGAPDISQRSREILRDEYAEHLLKRMNDSSDNQADE